MDDESPPPMPRSRPRRAAVSAEAYNPTLEDTMTEAFKTQEFPKSTEQMDMLRKVCKNILFLKCLPEDDLNVILRAFFERKVVDGELLIKQGDDGDNFYVVDKGTFAISILKDDVEKVVAELQDVGFFGELALLYNCPRSATVTSKGDGVVWGLDQSTFKHIVAGGRVKQRQEFDTLLNSIPMLEQVHEEERMKLADALETKVYADGEEIIRQGDEAESLYFIMDGQADIKIYDAATDCESLVATSGPGKYFGEMALLNKTTRSASVFANGRARCALLDVAAFERLLGSCKEIMLRNAETYKEERAGLGIRALESVMLNGNDALENGDHATENGDDNEKLCNGDKEKHDKNNNGSVVTNGESKQNGTSHVVANGGGKENKDGLVARASKMFTSKDKDTDNQPAVGRVPKKLAPQCFTFLRRSSGGAKDK